MPKLMSQQRSEQDSHSNQEPLTHGTCSSCGLSQTRSGVMGRNCVTLRMFVSILLLGVVTAYEYKMQAGVLGYPGSLDAEIYRQIADFLIKEMEEGRSERDKGHCAMYFDSLTFDTTNGSTFYNSLVKARDSFKNLGVAIAIGPFIDVFASTDYVILHQFHLLTSPAGENAGLMDPQKVVSILPEPKSMATVIADVIHKLQWKNVVLLSQDDFSPVLTLGQKGIQVWPIRLPTRIVSHEDAELRRNLIELRASEKNKFILHSTRRDIVHRVILAASRLHLLHHTIDWFITYPDFEDVIQTDEGTWPESLYGLQLLRPEKIPENITQELPINMSRLELGLALDVVGLMRHVLWRGAGNCVKPPLGSDHHITAHDFTRFFREKTLTYDGALGEYVWEHGDNARTNYTMDVLAFKGDFKKIGSVGFENSSLVVHLHAKDDKKIAPKRIFSDVLRIVTKQNVPFMIKQGNNYTGFAYDLLVALASKLNFRFELFDVTDRETDGDGTYGALVQELTAGNASMAVGALEVTAQRETVISFSYTILSTQATLLVRKPKNTQNFFQFLSPFKTGLWMMILAFIAVAAMALFLISRFDPTQQGVQQKFDLKESVWYALNILLQGSTEYSPQTTSMRAIIAFFWFSVLIIDAAYTANLAAYLTLQQIDSRIKTIHDLSRQTQIKYGMENSSSLMHFIQTQKEDPFERMWAFMKINEETSLLSNTTTIIENVKSGRFIFIADGVTNGYYAKQYCGIESIEQNFGAKDFALGFPRGAQYKDDINRGLLQLKESGVLDDLKHKWWTAGRNCTDDDDTMSSSEKTTAELNITNMVGVFIVLAAFTVLAIIVDISLRIYGETHDREEKKSAAVDEVPQKQAEEFT